MNRLAVVLFNLGGPDRPESVQPFLFNLFSDPAIIRLPQPFRWLMARLISSRRVEAAQANYAKLGGGSPLLPNTEAQAAALAAHLSEQEIAGKVRCFVAMRYWHPLAEETAAAVQAWHPDRVLLLPLYPQYSTTTSASSLKAWQTAARVAGLAAPTTIMCCHPTLYGFVVAMAERVRAALRDAGKTGQPRVLFSAHGLPKKIIEAGDPYQHQVERTAQAIVQALAGESFDWSVCYQSRVGPLEWIQPYTEQELRRAGTDGVPVVVVPIAFVSEHSETLVELDIEYRELADEVGIPAYVRTPTVDCDTAYITGLGHLVMDAVRQPAGLCAEGGVRICPPDRSGCAFENFLSTSEDR